MEYVNSSRQDACATVSKFVFWNRHIHIEFIDHILRHKEKDNLLEQSLFEGLSSL